MSVILTMITTVIILIIIIFSRLYIKDKRRQEEINRLFTLGVQLCKLKKMLSETENIYQLDTILTRILYLVPVPRKDFDFIDTDKFLFYKNNIVNADSFNIKRERIIIFIEYILYCIKTHHKQIIFD